ncbi:unnamed protein product [Sphagnum jensenii]
MTDQDIKTGKDMLEEDFIKKGKNWYKELELMVKTKEKAEIQVAGLGRGRTGMEIILHVPDGNPHSKLQGGGVHAHDLHVLVSFNSCIAKFSGALNTTE